MSSLDGLPQDQQAVLQLVLQRGRSYDDIANLLSIDRAAVRDRALAAMDALGTSTRLPPERRALITDYLLGQLPERVKEQIRERLAASPAERAWARVLAGELAPIASKPLPEIPSGEAGQAPAAPTEATPTAAPATGATGVAPAGREPTGGAEVPETAAGAGAPAPAIRQSSRRGGMILLALGALIVVVVLIIVIANSGSSSPKRSSTTSSNPGTTTTTGTTAATTPKVIAAVKLTPPNSSSKAIGIADVVVEGTVTGVVLEAAHVPPNGAHNAYGVWLTGPGGAAKLLGYVDPGVTKNGELKTSTQLPSNASSYNRIVVALETTTSTKAPGPIVLAGPLKLKAG